MKKRFHAIRHFTLFSVCQVRVKYWMREY
jgi:hypothetical protein